ncbi:hypothetical protein ACEQPO_28770 [Bacillus sp. SL00103]
MKRSIYQIGTPKDVLTESFFKEVFGIQAEVHLDGEHPIIPIASIQQQKGDEQNMIIVNNQVRVEKAVPKHSSNVLISRDK